MKGNPFLRLILVLLLLGAVFWPVWKLTRPPAESSVPATPAAAVPAPSPAHIASALRVTLLLHAAPAPLHCSVSQQGKVLLTETNRIAPGEYRASVEIVKGEDLLLAADWQDEEPHALRAEVLVHGYQAPLEKTFWARQSLEDTLPIPSSFLP